VNKGGEAKLASSKSLMFFGKMFNPNKSASVSPLQNEFTIQNSNKFSIQCILTLFTSGQQQTQIEPTKDIKSMFKFSEDMLENNQNESPKFSLDESLTQMSVSLEPEEKLTVKIDFIAPLKSNNTPSTNLINGLVKMKLRNFTKTFNVTLVGFLCESMLEIISSSNFNCDKIYMENLLISRNIKQVKSHLQLISSSGKTFFNILKLANKTKNNTRCMVYPILFDNNLKREIPSLTKGKETCFYLDKYEISLKLNFDSTFQRFKFNDENHMKEELTWFEISKNGSTNDDDTELPIAVEVVNSLKNTKAIRLEDLDLGHLSLCMFWIESEVNSFITANYKSTYNKIRNSESSTTIIDTLIYKLVNKYATSTDNLNASRDSIASNSMRSINGEENSFNSSILSNVSSNKIKLTKEDCVKLIKQSIKCCHVIFEIRGARDNDFKGKLHEVC